MTVHSERFGLDFPDDFPLEAYERVNAAISDPDEERRKRPAWSEWAAASNGLAYRYIAFAEHADELIASLTASLAPPSPERVKQEEWLFNFFVEGQSSLECTLYGAYFLASLVDPSGVAEEIDPQRITTKYVRSVFAERFATEPINARLDAVLDSSKYKDWTTARNILAHRLAPGRHHSTETKWLGSALHPRDFELRRIWLSESLTTLLVGLQDFAEAHLA